jgi:hypothetical protein
MVALTVALVVAACQSSGSSSSGLEGTWQWTASTEAVPATLTNVSDST